MSSGRRQERKVNGSSQKCMKILWMATLALIQMVMEALLLVEKRGSLDEFHFCKSLLGTHFADLWDACYRRHATSSSKNHE